MDEFEDVIHEITKSPSVISNTSEPFSPGVDSKGDDAVDKISVQSEKNSLDPHHLSVTGNNVRSVSPVYNASNIFTCTWKCVNFCAVPYSMVFFVD